jgi:hypothetical protein
MKGKRERPMKKGKVIQPPCFLPLLKLCASFGDASSLLSIVCTSTIVLFGVSLYIYIYIYIGNIDLHFPVVVIYYVFLLTIAFVENVENKLAFVGCTKKTSFCWKRINNL